MVLPRAAAVDRNQIEPGNRIGIDITIFAKNSLAFTSRIERDKVVYLAAFAAVDWNRGPMEGIGVNMAENLLLSKSSVRADPPRSNFVLSAVVILREGQQEVSCRSPFHRHENPGSNSRGSAGVRGRCIPTWSRIGNGRIKIDFGISSQVDVAIGIMHNAGNEVRFVAGRIRVLY